MQGDGLQAYLGSITAADQRGTVPFTSCPQRWIAHMLNLNDRVID